MTAVLNLAAALGTRDPALTRTRLVEARDQGHEKAVGELLLMAFFVTGFPAGLEAARIWADIRPGYPEGEGGAGVDYEARGRISCAAVYGSQYDRLLAGLEHLHPDLPELVVTVGYGRMMSRPTLPLEQRELCLVAMLIPWRAEAQLYSHLRGALLVGASEGQVEAAIDAGLAGAAWPGEDRAHAEGVAKIWHQVRERRNSPIEKET